MSKLIKNILLSVCLLIAFAAKILLEIYVLTDTTSHIVEFSIAFVFGALFVGINIDDKEDK